MSELWYLPPSISRLRQAVIAALEEIGSLDFSDPLMTEARHTVANLRLTLEETWVPTLDRIHESQAMIDWRHTVDVDEEPIRIVNALARGHRDPDDYRLRLLDHVLEVLSKDTNEVFPAEELAQLDALLAWISSNDISVSFERLDSLLGLLEQLDWMEAAGLMAIDSTRRRRVAVIFGAYFSTIAGFGVAVGRESQTISPYDVWLVRSPFLGGLIAEYSRAFGEETLVAVTKNLLSFNAHLGKWEADSHQIERWSETSLLLEVIARTPELVPRVVDGDTLLALATDHYLDPAAVEEVLAIALTSDLATGLTILGELTALAGDDNLTHGARRGIARGLAVLLGLIAPTIDRRTDVSVSVDGESVTLGSLSDLLRLLGQVLDDEIAQLILGLAISAMREERMHEVEQVLSQGLVDNSTEATLEVSTALIDIIEIEKLIEMARDKRDQLLALRHAVMVSRTATVVSTLGASSTSSPALGRAIAATASIAIYEGLDGRHRQLRGEEYLESWSQDSLLLTLGLPANSPEARRALGLDGIPESTWEEIRDLIEIAQTEPERRQEVVAILREYGVDHRDLDHYIKLVRSVSGELCWCDPIDPDLIARLSP